MTTRIAFVNGKGGVGKTTCSMLMAAAWQDAGQSVSLDDRDPQQSATNAAAIFGIPLGTDGNIVIVDTAPTIGQPATFEAIRTADLVVLVSTPSPLDLATTAATAQRIQAERTGPTRLLFNLVQTNNRFFTDMPETAKEIPFPALKHFLVRRTAYQTTQLYGWRALPPLHREEVLKVAIEVAVSRAKQAFAGKYEHGHDPAGKERRFFVQEDHLPHDCIEVYWALGGPGPITDPKILRELARRIRESLGIPVKPAPQLGEGQLESKPSSVPTPESAPPRPAQAQQPELPKAEPQAPAEPVPAPPAAAFNLGKWLADEFGQALKSLREQAAAKPPIEHPHPHEPLAAEEISPKTDAAGKEFAFELKSAPEREEEEPEEEEESTPEPPPPVDPRLFEIHNPDRLEWDDSDGLINFSGDDSEADLWRIRDASEGLLIFGSVGSGKTSGSGSAFARAFLQAGFGGLVLTAKPDEARRWLRMCRETGRADDYVHVTPGSDHKFSFLQYESQRPGNRIAVTDDLIALFRCLIGVMSRSKRSEVGDDFWSNTTNQLMRKLMDIFLLAGEPLTLDRMVRFINVAPTDAKTDWRGIKMFASVITRAEEAALNGTDEDKRICKDTYDYWTQVYPKITDVTRSGFITAFSAMADTLSGRGIYEMIGTETNLTPEMILSGKVVILDIPLKGNIQGGLMVQAMWKLLFQQAVERRADKGLKTARPAFLWEDEGHEFFSQNDVRFQPSARDCRAPHVIISQNLHNFFHLGHHEHAVKAVFAAMNTYIFHTNGDLDTNRWASERIGGIKKLKLTTDGLLKPLRDKDISFSERRPEEVGNVGKLKIAEETKPTMLPEDFAKLKRGGEGTCEAVILWLAHRFAANQNRNFCVLTFEQEPRT